MKDPLGSAPHEVPAWMRNMELISGVPAGLLETGKLTARDKHFAGQLLPDLAWNHGDRRSNLRHHRLGVRTVQYISFSIRPIPPKGQPDEDSFLARRPELAIYDPRGVRQRCIFADQNSPFRTEFCLNTAGTVEELLKEARAILDKGVDGLFIDHTFGISKCYGEELGIHEHLYHERDLRGIPEEALRFAPGTNAPNDDPLSNFAYAMLLKRMRELLNEYGPDKVLIGNTTFWPFKYSTKLRKYVLFSPRIHRRVPEIFWQYLDCGMVESYVVVPQSYLSPDSNEHVGERWQTYSNWEREAEIPAKYRRLGRRLIALPYAGAKCEREDVFFAYAAARVDDLIWAAWDSNTQVFCSFRLGRPIAEKRKSGRVLWRRFEHGLVALNPDSRPATAQLPVPWEDVRDVFRGKQLRASGGILRVQIPSDSGRVYTVGP